MDTGQFGCYETERNHGNPENLENIQSIAYLYVQFQSWKIYKLDIAITVTYIPNEVGRFTQIIISEYDYENGTRKDSYKQAEYI